MLLHLGAAHPLEVELVLLHLDDGVLDVGEADRQDNVLWSLSPHTSGRGDPEMDKILGLHLNSINLDSRYRTEILLTFIIYTHKCLRPVLLKHKNLDRRRFYHHC